MLGVSPGRIYTYMTGTFVSSQVARILNFLSKKPGWMFKDFNWFENIDINLEHKGIKQIAKNS